MMEPKKAIQSKTINFNGVLSIIIAGLVTFNLVSKNESETLSHLLTPETITAIIGIIGNIYLRFKTNSPITLK